MAELAEKLYATALFEVAVEEKLLEEMKVEFQTLKEILQEETDFLVLLDSPALSAEEKSNILKTVLEQKVNIYLFNCIHILCDKRRMYLFSKIAEEFLALYREHHRILMVTAISAVPLTEDQLKRLTVKLSGATQKKVTLQNQVDPTIIGGIVLQYDHKEIDGSVKEKLERLRQQIRTVIV